MLLWPQKLFSQARPCGPSVKICLLGSLPKPGASGQVGPKCQRRFTPYASQSLTLLLLLSARLRVSKQKAKERGTSYLEDATLPQALEYAQKTSTCDQYDQLTLQDLHKVLNEYEFAIVYAIYFEQRSVAEVARQKHKTRQAINQTKIKALQKIKEAWGKDKNTAI